MKPDRDRMPLAWAASLALACLLAVPGVRAQDRAAQPAAYKVARELQLALEARQAPVLPWLREVHGQRVVRVVVTGQGRGADLAAAREEIGRRGGQVLSHNPDTSSAVAVLPAALVVPIASRADVMHVAPDRMEGAPGAPAGPASQLAAVPGFAPGTTTLRGRNDLALLGE